MLKGDYCSWLQVLFMTIPGLSLFYGGLVRQKNVLSVLLQCLVVTALMTVQWTLFGYSMSFSSTGMAVRAHTHPGQAPAPETQAVHRI